MKSGKFDLPDILMMFWGNALLIMSGTVLGGILSVYFAFFVAVPEYTASSRFELSAAEASSPLSQAGGLASLAGLSLPATNSEADKLRDRILSITFVKDVFEAAEFRTDPVFNTYLAEPSTLSKVISFLLRQGGSVDPSDYDIQVAAKESLRNRLNIEIAEYGIITLSVSHLDPKRASQVANVIVDHALADMLTRSKIATRASLDHYSSELLGVRARLDAANAAVRDYAISNNLQSAEVLSRTSSQLTQLRAEIAELEQLKHTIAGLADYQASDFEGDAFATLYPLATSIQFRRLFGWGNDPATWQYPTSSDITASLDANADQLRNLRQNLTLLQEQARASGNDALELQRLERDVAVQLSVYQSVISQFEANSIFSGFEQESGTIIEPALQPRRPSSPRKALLLALGLSLGFFGAFLVVFVRALKREKIFKAAEIIETYGIKSVWRVNRRSLPKLNGSALSQKELLTISDIKSGLSTNAKSVALLTPSAGNWAARIAFGLSQISATNAQTAAVIDLSNTTISGVTWQKSKAHPQLDCSEGYFGKVDLYRPSDLQHTDEALESLRKALSAYDKVFFICPPSSRGIALSVFATEISDQVVVVADKLKSYRAAIRSMTFSLATAGPKKTLLLLL